MENSKNWQHNGFIEFSTVRKAFKEARIIQSPLLFPVDKIEEILRSQGYLEPGLHLNSYDCNKEAFPIIRFNDRDHLEGKLDKIRRRLAKYILPK